MTESINDSIQVTWSAYNHADNNNNAERIKDHQFNISITSLTLLHSDKAHDLATVKHTVDKSFETTQYLNHLQTPVVAADQPLHALAKQIQCAWPEEYGNFFIRFVGLHFEMTAFLNDR